MPQNVRQIGFDALPLPFVADVEGGHSQIRLERLVSRVIQGVVGSIVPESGILVPVMSGS